MKKRTEEELDKLLRQAVQARMEGFEPPPIEEARKRFETRLRHHEAERRKVRPGPWRVPRLALAAILLLAVAVSVAVLVWVKGAASIQ